MAEVVDLRSVWRGIRRRWHVIVAVFLVGVVAAGLYVVLSPTTYVATVRVVLPPSPVDAQGNATRDINTEVQIAEGAAVLGPASQSLQPPISLSALRAAISVRGATSQIFLISGQSANAARAAQLANAVSTSYVAYADDTATSEANATVAAYSQQISQLNQQVQQLNQQITSDTAGLAGLNPARTQDQQAVIDNLRSAETTLAEQLNNDQTQIADAQLQAQVSKQGTQVLQPALVPGSPSSPKPLLDVVAGALAGLVIGVIAALGVESGDHRLRTRDAISAAAGAPVLASATVKPADRAARTRGWVRQWEPSVVESYALRQAFARLESRGDPVENLVVVGLEGDAAAGALALELAMFHARSGTETAFVLASRDQAGAALRAACGEAADRPGLTVYGARGSVEEDRLRDAELTVTFVVADPGPLVLPNWDRATRVVVAVSAGFCDADTLEATAAACHDAGVTLSCVFVANPDPRDRSTGQGGAGALMADTSWAGPSRAASPASAERASTLPPHDSVTVSHGSATASRPTAADVTGTPDTGISR